MGGCHCASTGGMYRSYATLQGSTELFRRCLCQRVPPRPEALLDAMIKLQDKIGRESAVKNLTAQKAEAVGAGKAS